MRKFEISYVQTVKQREVRQKEISWEGLKALLYQCKFEYDQKDGPGLVPSAISEGQDRKRGRGKGRWRQAHCVDSVSLLCLDIEEHDFGADSKVEIVNALKDRLPGVAMYVYTSWHHGVERCTACCNGKSYWTEGEPRLRVIVPLSAPVTPGQYRHLWRWAEDLFPGVDANTKDVTRISYLPRQDHPQAVVDGWIEEVQGASLDIEAIPVEGEETHIDGLCDYYPDDEPDRTISFDQVRTAIGDGFSVEALRDALSHIDGNEDYDRWLRVGMALKSYAYEGFISEQDAASLWDEWSQGAANYDPSSLAEKWQSFDDRGDDGVTIGTVIHLAREAGWSPPGRSGDGTEGPYLASKSDPTIASFLQSRLYATQARVHLKGVVHYPEKRDWGQDDGDEFADWMDESCLAWDMTTMWGYDPEEGVWRDITKDEIVYNAQRLDGAMYGDGKTLTVNYAKGKSVYDTLAAEARHLYGEFFTDVDTASVKFRDVTVAWTGEELIEWFGSRSPIGVRCRHKIDLELTDDDEKFFDDRDVSDCEWVQFLRSCFIEDFDPDEYDQGDDEESEARIEAIQRYVGAALFGCGVDTQKALMFVGPGGGGKSVAIDVIEALFDDRDISHVSPQQMGDDNGAVPLATSVLNTVSDVDRQSLLQTGKLKQIITGDGIQIRPLYNDPEICRPTAGHIFSINEFPATKDQSRGFWDRWLLIEFPMQFRGTDCEDKTLSDRLKQPENLRDMAVWAIKGFIDWVASDRQIEAPRCHQELMGQWQRESDSVTDFYEKYALNPVDKLDNSKWTIASAAYRHYQHWCDSVGRKAVSQTKFGQRLGKICEKKRLAAGEHYALGTPEMLDVVEE